MSTQPNSNSRAQGQGFKRRLLTVLAAAGAFFWISTWRRSPLLSEGLSAPAWQLTLLGGTTVRSQELKGQVVVLEFFATWCPPCRESLPTLASLAAEDSGARIFAVNQDEVSESHSWTQRDAVVTDFLREHHWAFPVLMDDGTMQGAFHIDHLPTLIVIDPVGRIAFAESGVFTLEDLRAEIQKARSP